MSLQISYRMANKQFQDKVRELSAQNVSNCYQCGTCAGSCPMHAHISATPRKMMAYLQLGLSDAAEKMNTHWICASCHTCEVRCPRGIDIPRVMEALRQITLRKNCNRIEPSTFRPEDIADMPQIALVSGFRKLTG